MAHHNWIKHDKSYWSNLPMTQALLCRLQEAEGEKRRIDSRRPRRSDVSAAEKGGQLRRAADLSRQPVRHQVRQLRRQQRKQQQQRQELLPAADPSSESLLVTGPAPRRPQSSAVPPTSSRTSGIRTIQSRTFRPPSSSRVTDKRWPRQRRCHRWPRHIWYRLGRYKLAAVMIATLNKSLWNNLQFQS